MKNKYTTLPPPSKLGIRTSACYHAHNASDTQFNQTGRLIGRPYCLSYNLHITRLSERQYTRHHIFWYSADKHAYNNERDTKNLPPADELALKFWENVQKSKRKAARNWNPTQCSNLENRYHYTDLAKTRMIQILNYYYHRRTVPGVLLIITGSISSETCQSGPSGRKAPHAAFSCSRYAQEYDTCWLCREHPARHSVYCVHYRLCCILSYICRTRGVR